MALPDVEHHPHVEEHKDYQVQRCRNHKHIVIGLHPEGITEVAIISLTKVIAEQKSTILQRPKVINESLLSLAWLSPSLFSMINPQIS